jgi:hypothetical protein
VLEQHAVLFQPDFLLTGLKYDDGSSGSSSSSIATR